MRAIDRLCALLDERGVEWFGHNAPASDCIAFFDGSDWHDCWEGGGEKVNMVFAMAPEQAVEATLGRGECRNLYEPGDFKCSECGHFTTERMAYRDGTPATPRYCPWCGRKVVA